MIFINTHAIVQALRENREKTFIDLRTMNNVGLTISAIALCAAIAHVVMIYESNSRYHAWEWQKQEVKEAQLSLVAKEYDDIPQEINMDGVTMVVRAKMTRSHRTQPWTPIQYRTVSIKDEDDDMRLKLHTWQEIGGLGHFLSPNHQYVYDGYYTFYRVGPNMPYSIKNNQLFTKEGYFVGDISTHQPSMTP